MANGGTRETENGRANADGKVQTSVAGETVKS